MVPYHSFLEEINVSMWENPITLGSPTPSRLGCWAALKRPSWLLWAPTVSLHRSTACDMVGFPDSLARKFMEVPRTRESAPSSLGTLSPLTWALLKTHGAVGKAQVPGQKDLGWHLP